MANGNFGGGSGTELDPYLIEDVLDLVKMGNYGSTQYFKLVQDIDLNAAPYNTGTGWTALGGRNHKLDGNGKSIKNLYQREVLGKSTGLFISALTHVKDLTIENIDIEGVTDTYARHGALLGLGSNGGVYERIKATGKMKITKGSTNTCNAGGIIGTMSGTAYAYNMISEVNMTLFDACQRAGGVIGYNITLGKNLLYTGKFTPVAYGSDVGAVAGAISNASYVFENCYYDKTLNPVTFTQNTNSTGKTTEELMDPTTYIGWENELLDNGKKVWSLRRNKYAELWFAALPFNQTLILHDGEYKKFSPRVEATSRKIIVNEEISEATFSASSTFNSTTLPQFAFDEDDSTAWLSNYTLGNPSWIKIDLTEPKKLASYSLMCNSSQQNPNSWIFQGSNDNLLWEDLDVRNEVLVLNKKTLYNISNPKNYRYYRVYITGYVETAVNSIRIRFNSIELYEYVPVVFEKWNSVSSISPTSQQFISDGMDSLSLLDRKVILLEPQRMDIKSGVLQPNEEGKVFSKKINLKKHLDIRKIEVK